MVYQRNNVIKICYIMDKLHFQQLNLSLTLLLIKFFNWGLFPDNNNIRED